MANKKITDVDVVSTINDADYLFVNQGQSIKQIKKSDIPKPIYTAEEVGALPNTTTTLPNPNVLTFTGAATGSYDGSSPVEINIPEGGGTGVTVDNTLSVAGQAADAKATGDAISQLSDEIADKATLENGVVKFWKTSTEENRTDTLLYSVDISSIGGAGGLDLENLTLSVSQVGNYQRLSMSDGTTTKNVDIPIITITDEQVQTAVTEYLDANPVQTGATQEEAEQIQKNTNDIAALKGDLSQLSEEIANKTRTGLSTEAIDKLEEVGNYLTYITADGGSKWTELISILRNGSSGGGSGGTIPATGITLDKTTLSFTDSATQTLVATVEPSDTTDKIVWTSNAESVAKVTNGVVKPLSNGSATITATCGSVSATCSVTVDIAEEEQVTLTSISATYTGGDVAIGTALTDLTGITVTATYSDGSTSNVTGYTLSGTIAEGENTITVSYGGKTTTFTVIGTASVSAGETIVYNVFNGEYINSGYSGDNYTNYGANYNIYQEEIDVTDASTLYYRFGRNNKVMGATQSGLKLGVYSSDGSVLGVLDLSDSSTVTKVDGKYDINGLETLDDGTVIYGIYVASVSLSSFENKSYVKFAVLRSSNFVPSWNGNAQSTSALSLEV